MALAEDDGEMRRLVATDLRRDGFDVIELSDGAELRDYLFAVLAGDTRIRRADLVVTDVRMPHMDGLTALALLAHHPHALPSIVVTAFGDGAVHEDAARLGAVAVLDKPFDLRELRDAVHRGIRIGVRRLPRPSRWRASPRHDLGRGR